MVYLAIIGGGVKVYFDEQTMLDEGVTPGREVTEEEYYAARGRVRVIDGEIVLGMTAAERAAGIREMRENECKMGLAEIDREAGAGRQVRALAVEYAAAAGKSADKDDPNYDKGYDRLLGYEERAGALRETLDGLKGENETGSFY